ncbi:uncharacterized protein [Drosophila kikkawai]|uniref:Uncharacterized protein n=1 Tax=Drosophila kikkawai TaxID=30033 RepID=A0A6P4IDI2_DROKI|nr:pollen-specific leucine-rich repeat extensin-like protein 1 [Drosophila kikkawai]
MSGDMHATPQSGRRPRLGLGRRTCQSTPRLRLQGEEPSVKTPKSESLNTPSTFPLSLSARRIGLSKNRTELTKKKLEFAMVQEIKENKPSVSQEKAKKTNEPKKKNQRREKGNKQEDEKGKNKEKDLPGKQKEEAPKKREQDSPNKLQQESPKNLEPTQPKSSKILELQGDIEIWRKGFIASVDDLQAMAEPGLTKRELLTQLGIPLEMLRYLEED